MSALEHCTYFRNHLHLGQSARTNLFISVTVRPRICASWAGGYSACRHLFMYGSRLELYAARNPSNLPRSLASNVVSSALSCINNIQHLTPIKQTGNVFIFTWHFKRSTKCLYNTYMYTNLNANRTDIFLTIYRN